MTARASPEPAAVDGIEIFHGLRLLAPVLAAVTAAGAVALDRGPLFECLLVTATVPLFALWAWRPAVGPLSLTICVTSLMIGAVRLGVLEPAMFLLSIAATVVGSFETSRLRLIVATAILGGAPTLATILFSPELATGIWTGGILLPLVLTRATRRQAMLSLELAEARAALADQRVLEERRRIARDVHDSVGHGLAAVLLHITGARHVLRRDLDAADEALVAAEAVGHRSMLELRQTLGLLRAEPGGPPAAPVPDARALAALGIGIVGDVQRIGQMAGLSLHRVAEEAMANVRQHATGRPTVARLEVGQDEVVLTIESRGRSIVDAGASDRPHYGIVGMHERMAAVGGELFAGPSGDGWVVQATAPLRGRR